MNKTEKLIANLRKRRKKICFYSCLGVTNLTFSIFFFAYSRRFLFSLPGHELANDNHMMMAAAFVTFVIAFFNLLFATYAITYAAIELFFCSKDRLLVEMWDRIRELEKQNNI